jgi:hypothetical protein
MSSKNFLFFENVGIVGDTKVKMFAEEKMVGGRMKMKEELQREMQTCSI